MTDAKNFDRYKRLINRQLLQVSGLCGSPLRYLVIAQYGDAMLVPTLRGTNMAAGNQ